MEDITIDICETKSNLAAGAGIKGPSPLLSPLLQRDAGLGVRVIPPAASGVPARGSRAALQSMPEDAIVRIFSYLSAADIGRVGASSKWLKQKADEPSLWANLFASDFDVQTAERKMFALEPKKLYRQRLQRHKGTVYADAAARAQQIAVANADKKRFYYATSWTCYAIFVVFIATLTLLLAFSVVLSRRLDDAVAASWWEVTVPLWILLALWVILLLYAVIAKLLRKFATSNTNACYNIDLKGLHLLPSARRHPCCRGLSLCHVVLTALALVAIPVLLVVKVQYDATFSWAVALVPVWLLIVLLFTTCCVYKVSNWGVPIVMNLLLTLPIFLLLLLLTLVLDKVADIPYHQVFIPCWIVFGLLLIVCCCFWVTSCCRSIAEGGMSEACASTGAICGAAIFFCLPLLSALLLVLRLDDVRQFTWLQIFSPFGVWLSIALLMSLLFACYSMRHDVIRVCLERKARMVDRLAV